MGRRQKKNIYEAGHKQKRLVIGFRKLNHKTTDLRDAGMRVSQEKSKFFKKSVEYLGFTVCRRGIQSSPDKIKAIKDFPAPKTLFALSSFLGLEHYYSCFISGFANIARPLTDISCIVLRILTFTQTTSH